MTRNSSHFIWYIWYIKWTLQRAGKLTSGSLTAGDKSIDRFSNCSTQHSWSWSWQIKLTVCSQGELRLFPKNDNFYTISLFTASKQSWVNRKRSIALSPAGTETVTVTTRKPKLAKRRWSRGHVGKIISLIKCLDPIVPNQGAYRFSRCISLILDTQFPNASKIKF
jgi:hypothetical protein